MDKFSPKLSIIYFTTMKINKFEEYGTLYVFDFDDTLVESPSFEELAMKYLKENYSVKDLLNISIKRSGCKIEDLKWENGRIYLDDPNHRYKEFGNWVRKKSRLYLVTPNIFSQIDESLPKKLKPLIDLYNKVDNKCIVTARSEEIRPKIISVLSKLGIEYPKHGLHMLPINRKNAGTWKGEKIVELVDDNDFNKVIFYDDNSKYLRKATSVIKEKLPTLDWEPIKVN